MKTETYRQIAKWGDKRDQLIEAPMRKLLKEKFGLSDADFETKHLAGEQAIQISPSNLTADQLSELSKLAGQDNVSTDNAVRANRSYGKFYMDLLKLRLGEIPSPPDAVIFPKDTQAVVAIVDYCNAHRIALTPYGAGSSVTRGAEPAKGGVVLDLTRHMNRVLEVNELNHTTTVQAGMYGPAFEEYLNAYGKGYTCGHFPQSFEYSTVGGWVAAKGAGQASTGYGKIEQMTLGLQVVTPAGVIENKPFPATAQGWDLFPLFIGSEGTLGVITAVTMKIHKVYKNETSYASFVFKSFQQAVDTMRKSVQGGFGKPHLFRISDPEETDIAFNTKGFDGSFSDKALQILGYKPGERCLMFVSVEGEKAYTHLVTKKISKLASANQGLFIGGKPTKKWLTQRFSSAYMRDPLMDLGIMTDTIETAVMWDKLISLWQNVRSYLKQRPDTVVMVHISHVYENGANLYFTFLSPMQKGNEKADFTQYHAGLVETILKNGGSLSHHHGVGKALAQWMPQALGAEQMAWMQAIKKHVDPNGIMNPGGTLGL